MARRDDKPQPDPLAALRTELEQLELYLVLQGLLAAVETDDENAFAILASHREFTTPTGRHIEGMWQDDWEGAAGSTLGPKFRDALADYEHRRDLRIYGTRFQPCYDAFQSSETDPVRLAALMEMFALWHDEMRQRSYLQDRTRDELGRRYGSQLYVDRDLRKFLERFIESYSELASTNQSAFDDLYDLRLQYLGIDQERRGAGPTFHVTHELRNWFVWTDPDNWHTLVDLYIDVPTPADFGDDRGEKISVQKFVELANAALAKTGTRLMAKRVFALVVYDGRNNLSSVTVENLRRKAARIDP